MLKRGLKVEDANVKNIKRFAVTQKHSKDVPSAKHEFKRSTSKPAEVTSKRPVRVGRMAPKAIALESVAILAKKFISTLEDINVDFEGLIGQDYARKLEKNSKYNHYSEKDFEASDEILDILYIEQERDKKLIYELTPFVPENRHPDISHATLAKVCNWMVSAQEALEINHETLHLSVGLLYSFLSLTKERFSRQKLALLSGTCIWVATKHEERCAPRCQEVINSMDGHFDNAFNLQPKDMMAFEVELVKTIKFTVNRPNAYVLLRRYSRILDPCNVKVQYLSRFLAEASLYSHSTMMIGESKRAAVCLALARCIVYMKLDDPSTWEMNYLWPPVLELFTRFSFRELIPNILNLHAKTKWLLHHALEPPSPFNDSTVNLSMDEQGHVDRDVVFDFTVSKYVNPIFEMAARIYYEHAEPVAVKLQPLT